MTMTSAYSNIDGFTPTDRYRKIVVFTLAMTYMFNFLDRQLLSVLAQPIKMDLSLSDTQLGALTGLTFAVFYSTFGIPIAAFADRGNRIRVVGMACGVWSLFSAASGFATNLATLSLARIGVGIGEAGCSPPAYSIIADYFPPSRRGGALAAYSIGVPFGSLFGIAAGGWIAAHYGWRAAFLTVGSAGLILAPLIPLIVKEPRRGSYDVPLDPLVETKSGQASIAAALYFVVRSPLLILNALAAGFTAFVCYAILNWAPAYLMRVQGMSLTSFASIYGIVNAASMALGLWARRVFRRSVCGKKSPALRPPAGYSNTPCGALYFWRYGSGKLAGVCRLYRATDSFEYRLPCPGNSRSTKSDADAVPRDGECGIDSCYKSHRFGGRAIVRGGYERSAHGRLWPTVARACAAVAHSFHFSGFYLSPRRGLDAQDQESARRRFDSDLGGSIELLFRAAQQLG